MEARKLERALGGAYRHIEVGGTVDYSIEVRYEV